MRSSAEPISTRGKTPDSLTQNASLHATIQEAATATAYLFTLDTMMEPRGNWQILIQTNMWLEQS